MVLASATAEAGQTRSLTRADVQVAATDQARPVDVDKLQGRELSDLRPGGLGTFIISQVFDEVKYQPMEIGTSLILRKRLP